MRSPGPSPGTPGAARLVALALGVAASPAALLAQAAGTIAVSALVGEPVTVTTQQGLAFTTVFPGVAKVVSPVTGGTAGATPAVARVQGRPGDEVELTFGLPGALASGPRTLPVDTWVACVNTVDSPAGCTTFAVSSSGRTARLNAPGNPPAGRLWVRLGATARPTPTQQAGTYTGTVTLSAAYTGL